MRRAASLVMIAALVGCSKAPPPPGPVETTVPEELRTRPARAPAAAPSGKSVGTPMSDRVATLGLLNKRNNIAQDLVLKPGETRRFGDVIVALKACERTAPWEMPEETGAFVQVWVKEARQEGFGKIFSGWLFRESPSLNVVEHPIYDVWVKACAMRFPGEESTPSGSPSDKPSAPKDTPKPAAATPSPAPAPASPAPNDATA